MTPTPFKAATPTPGCCHLVGAGPGDPDLLTLKAVKAIGQATLLLVDDLVSEAVLELAPATARVVRVGKRGGCRSTPQDFIERLMVRAARRGERVVRLKGGDPFLFGRGGEEVERLRQAGVAVEVVNGITSGQAALTSLGVPLTQRQRAHGVLFVTAHHEPGVAGPDWPALARASHTARLTLLIYMGARQVAQIQAGLLQGLGPDTPVAIVQNASRPEQRHAVGRLDGLAHTMAEHRLASPCIIAVGDVLQGLAAAAEHAALDNVPEPLHGAVYDAASALRTG